MKPPWHVPPRTSAWTRTPGLLPLPQPAAGAALLCAAAFRFLLTNDPVWEQGYCPICGSLPGLSCLESDGQRFLFCSFCWHKWPLLRQPGSRASALPLQRRRTGVLRGRLRVLRKYIETVDTRVLGRYSYPPLEQVASLHLDIKAAEAGYAAGIPITPP